jgi:hypothetical protein
LNGFRLIDWDLSYAAFLAASQTVRSSPHSGELRRNVCDAARLLTQSAAVHFRRRHAVR